MTSHRQVQLSGSHLSCDLCVDNNYFDKNILVRFASNEILNKLGFFCFLRPIDRIKNKLS